MRVEMSHCPKSCSQAALPGNLEHLLCVSRGAGRSQAIPECGLRYCSKSLALGRRFRCAKDSVDGYTRQLF